MISKHIEALKDEDRLVRHAAAEMLGESSDIGAVPALLQALKDEDYATRGKVADALGTLRAVSAVAALVQTLKDEAAHVRWTAANALGMIGSASAVPGLMSALEDEYEYVRWAAAGALGRIRSACAVPGLIRALDDVSLYVRLPAIKALGHIGDAGAVPALIRALKDEHSLTRETAAAAIQHVGDTDTLPRKILATTWLSAQQKIELLDTLRQVRYGDRYRVLRYSVPKARALCQAVLSETVVTQRDAAAQAGAQAVLNWLNGDRNLLRGSQPDAPDAAQDLLRASNGATLADEPKTLLRASRQAENGGEAFPTRRTLWEWLFKESKEGTP